MFVNSNIDLSESNFLAQEGPFPKNKLLITADGNHAGACDWIGSSFELGLASGVPDADRRRAE